MGEGGAVRDEGAWVSSPWRPPQLGPGDAVPSERDGVGNVPTQENVTVPGLRNLGAGGKSEPQETSGAGTRCALTSWAAKFVVRRWYAGVARRQADAHSQQQGGQTAKYMR